MAECLCRLCGGKTDNISVAEYQDKIRSLLGIEVSITDVKTTMCRVCKVKVDEFWEFKSIVSLAQGKEPPSFGKVKIKEEPEDEDDPPKDCVSSPFTGRSFPSAPWFPTYYTLDKSGTFVPVTMPVPVVPNGKPIPLTDMNAFPVVSPIPAASHSPSKEAEDVKISESLVKKEKLESESSDDLGSAEDIINEIVADKDENSKTSSEGDNGEPVHRKKEALKQNGTNESKSDSSDNEKENPKVSSSTQNEEGNSDMESEPTKAKRTPVSSSARRGRKRRGSSIPSSEPLKRTRNTRNSGNFKPSETEAEDKPPVRVTRSGSGARTTRKRVVVSSDSDGDFDGDDIDDPEYCTPKRKKSESSSDSSDDASAETKSKDTPTNKEKEKKTTQTQPAPMVRPGRASKEDSVKKVCPHCDLSYKYWVSYDDHVKSCEEETRKKKEQLEKEGPKPEEPEVDDDKEQKCIVCLTKVVGTKALKEHMTTHQAKKGPPYQCKICEETFEDKGGLICHNALHHRNGGAEPIMKTERKKLHCVECNETFQNSGDYICHQVLHHKRK